MILFNCTFKLLSLEHCCLQFGNSIHLCTFRDTIANLFKWKYIFRSISTSEMIFQEGFSSLLEEKNVNLKIQQPSTTIILKGTNCLRNEELKQKRLPSDTSRLKHHPNLGTPRTPTPARQEGPNPNSPGGIQTYSFSDKEVTRGPKEATENEIAPRVGADRGRQRPGRRKSGRAWDLGGERVGLGGEEKPGSRRVGWGRPSAMSGGRRRTP